MAAKIFWNRYIYIYIYISKREQTSPHCFKLHYTYWKSQRESITYIAWIIHRNTIASKGVKTISMATYLLEGKVVLRCIRDRSNILRWHGYYAYPCSFSNNLALYRTDRPPNSLLSVHTFRDTE